MNGSERASTCKQKIVQALNEAAMPLLAMVLLLENVRYEVLLEMDRQHLAALEQKQAESEEPVRSETE